MKYYIKYNDTPLFLCLTHYPVMRSSQYGYFNKHRKHYNEFSLKVARYLRREIAKRNIEITSMGYSYKKYPIPNFRKNLKRIKVGVYYD